MISSVQHFYVRFQPQLLFSPELFVLLLVVVVLCLFKGSGSNLLFLRQKSPTFQGSVRFKQSVAKKYVAASEQTFSFKILL